MKLSELKIFEEAFSNLPVFKEHPLYTTELEEGKTDFNGYRGEWQVRDDNYSAVGRLLDPYKNEEYLSKYAAELTAEQVKLILDSTYSNLFQNGVSHISWNTDRYNLMCAIIKAQGEVITTKTWDETWTKDTSTWYKLKNGLVIKGITEVPRVYDINSRTNHRFCVVKEEDVPVVPTHIAVTFFTDGYDSVRINKHFSGTHDECVEWVRQYSKTNMWAILDTETYRKNYAK